MTDPKAGIADIKKKIPVPNHQLYGDIHRKTTTYSFQARVSMEKHEPAVFQRIDPVPVEVSEYNSKPGNLEL